MLILQSSFAEDDSEPPGFTAEDSSVVSQPITSTAPIKTAHAPTTTTSSSAGLGLFDDSGGEEDLFTTLATQKSKYICIKHLDNMSINIQIDCVL